jgi:transcriptional regulator NrdR family protein
MLSIPIRNPGSTGNIINLLSPLAGMLMIVKRRGKHEPFDEKKVYASVYAACMDCALGENGSEKLAKEMTDKVRAFMKGKDEVNTSEIFGFVLQHLAKINEPAAFMYQTHREIPKV